MKNNFSYLITLFLLIGGATALNTSTLNGQTTISMRPYTDAAISYHDGYPTASTNYGNAIHYSGFYQPGAAGGVNFGQGLMRFDLLSIPSTATITSATLDLYGAGPVGPGDVTNIGHVGTNDCYLERIITPWNEMTVTWNTRPTATATNHVTLPASSSVYQDYIGIDVTELVQDMVTDSANSHGFLIRLLNETTSRGLIFASTNFSDTTHHPRLTVTYTNNSTSSDDTQAMLDFQVWPSPVTALLNVALPSNTPGYDITVIDITGNVVLHFHDQRPSSKLPIETLTPGTYMIQAKSQNHIYSRKFVKI